MTNPNLADKLSELLRMAVWDTFAGIADGCPVNGAVWLHDPSVGHITDKSGTNDCGACLAGMVMRQRLVPRWRWEHSWNEAPSNVQEYARGEAHAAQKLRALNSLREGAVEHAVEYMATWDEEVSCKYETGRLSADMMDKIGLEVDRITNVISIAPAEAYLRMADKLQEAGL